MFEAHRTETILRSILNELKRTNDLIEALGGASKVESPIDHTLDMEHVPTDTAEPTEY